VFGITDASLLRNTCSNKLILTPH